MIKSRSYSSNLTKLVKHLDKLENIQQGKPTSPVMKYISLTKCNPDILSVVSPTETSQKKMPTEKVFRKLESFKAIGVTGVEFTGGGEPSVFTHTSKRLFSTPKDLGFSLGICTNSARFTV